MAEYDYLKALGQDLKNQGVDQYGRLVLQGDAEEFGGGYSLRLYTPSDSLQPELMRALSACSCGLSFLGEAKRMRRYQWLITPPEEQ